ncbi:synaptotagmin-2-like [Bidens hawaiensis]|uniref:synaptotagmin-2-like n=1 Tax=Bidens hawaiensis TaxID=980011 RepID=UPI0040495E0A
MVSESDGAGVLMVTIHRGFNLNVRRPYVGVLVGSDKKYTTAKQSKNPVWEESLRFGLEKPAEAELLLVVYSDLTMDKFLDKHILGRVRISVADVVREKHMNSIYHIGNGRIHAELQFRLSARLPMEF